ncbi:nucleolar protein 58-like [Nylanderia fulva]|uniref:nucleolar protein 58-like n=1 Tax=Nylanderia fulva TaxID=613905 RepID=UPI0010FB2CF0|nr:nucleolar protein 58-like [Nylanderia fulva]
MVRPSNPRLMARVLDAVTNLGDTKGSSAREVLSFIRQSNVSPKNLTVQVHRALKHAVNAGLLRHRSGRYKALATLNPTSVPTPSANKETINDNQKTKEKKSKSDVKVPLADAESSSRRTQERKKTTSRQPNTRHRSRRNSSKVRRSRRSPYPRRSNKTVQNRKRRQRKRKYEDEEVEDQSSERYTLHGRDNESPVPFNRKTKRSRVSKRELESDFSDESDRESDVNRKRVSRSSKALSRQPRRKETKEKRGRSASRARSPQLLQRTMQGRQHPIEEVGNDRQQCDENRGSMERDTAHSQEAHQEEDVAGVCEPNDSHSHSGSTLENLRD